jgi:hypothetical protein
MIVLCCSFAQLSFKYDYSGLATFMPFVDCCVFLDSGLSSESIKLINEHCSSKKIHWYKHAFSDFSNMRNRLIKLAIKAEGKDTYIFMIDDCYSLEGSGIINPCCQLQFNYEIEDYDGSTYKTKYVKLFEAKSHKYVLQAHEVLIGPPDVIAEDTTLILRDIPDKKRTTERARRDIAMLRQDLHEYGADNFLRNHIFRYLFNSHMLLGEEDCAKKYLELSLMEKLLSKQ